MGNEKDESPGAVLRELRVGCGLGIKSAAPMAGISYGYLSKIENDVKQPSLGLITELCRIYDADADAVIAKTGALPPDVKEIVKTHGKGVFDLLRSTYTDD
ncbi:MAG: helix-turn-helix transcriptional regulator [Proteobacteria bacterium]|nr:helix-turn-helix transcriptional regulator [Pseudomonadota bacterium]